MKNLKRKLILPVMAIALAVGGAFVTTTAKANERNVTQVDGHYYDVQRNTCVNTNVQCSTMPTDELCTSSGVQLYELQGTSCEIPLYRIQP